MLTFDWYWDQKDVDKFNKSIDNAMTDLHKTPEAACRWAAVKLCESLSASTKVSSTLRPIVRNPLFKASDDGKWTKAQARQAKGDMRRARFGVNRWKPTGEKFFQPIYRTGRYGNIRFVEKNGRRFAKDLVTKEWVSVDGGATNTLGGDASNFINHPKRKIRNSGLAKKVWQWTRRNIVAGGVAKIDGVPEIASVLIIRRFDFTTIKINNNLRYASAAFVGGKKDEETALVRASDSMEFLIDDKLKKATAY
ncbi:MAG: hypothetical protein WC455_28570 [Dehalococcoidia bacterium]|jgi:hypothetical protein